MSTTSLVVDLADPALYGAGDPEPIWARLRETDPVYWNERPDGRGFWAVTRYHDIARVLKNTDVFTSEQGMSLDGNDAAEAAAAGKMLIVTDPPRHRELRGVIGTAFTPRAIRRLADNMRRTVTEALDPILEAGGGDFDVVASRLPVSVISDLLGIPRQDWDFMLENTKAAFGYAASPVERAMAHADLMCYYAEYLDYRRRHPGDDVVSAMLAAEIDGRPLADEEILLNCDGLISGGNETTRHASMRAALALSRDPEQWDRLARATALPDTVVPEVLRFGSPALHVLRTATWAVRVGDRIIRPGERVTLWLPAGNRDESMFPRGDVFDTARPRRQTLTFGAGPHHCIGSRLAELELTVLFEELTRRVGRLEPDGPVRRLHSNLIWGIESLPLVFRPAAR